MIDLNALSFGDPTAEADGRFLFDKSCFLETDSFKDALRLSEPMFFVGRRGAGKSALALALNRRFSQTPNVICVSITPKDFVVAHAKSLARGLIQRADVNWDFLFRSLWATTLRGAWCLAVTAHYKLRDTEENDRQELETFLSESGITGNELPEYWLSKNLQRLNEILHEGVADPLGAISDALVSFRAEAITLSLKRVLERNELRLITLIDGLDENWDGSNTGAQLLSGLLTQSALDYSSVGAVTFAFLRENMYRRVRNLCPRWDRIEGYFRQLSWEREQIEELILTRAERAIDRDEAGWSDVFESNVNGENSLDYMLQRTQFKPREMILFCKYSLERARRHRATKIRGADIQDAERVYSDNRLRDVINEYQDALPELEVVFVHFQDHPQSMPRDEMLASLREFVSSGKYSTSAPKLCIGPGFPDSGLRPKLAALHAAASAKDARTSLGVRCP